MADITKRFVKTTQLKRQGNRRYQYNFHRAIGVILFLCLLGGCAAKDKPHQLELTPVAAPPTGIHYPGKFIWNDLLTDDVTTAKKFYGQLLGWNFKELNGYTVVENDNQAIGGMVEIIDTSEKPGAARWLSSMSVVDVDKAVSLVRQEGGTIENGSMELLNRGKGALIRDPLGAQLLLLYATDGDPRDKEPSISSWLWHELWSNNTEASLAFYQKLIGYDFSGDKNDYLILLKNERWRAGIRHSSDPDLEVRWVPVVRVANTKKIADQVELLGGKVVIEPQPSASGGSVALLADPSDGLFIIQRWHANSSEQEN